MDTERFDGIKKILFRVTDMLNESASFLAIRRAFICIIPITIIRIFSEVLLRMPIHAYQDILHSKEMRIILNFITDAYDGCDLLTGVIACAAVSHYYVMEKNPAWKIVSWITCPVAMISYGLMFNKEIIRGEYDKLGSKMLIVAILVGLISTKIFLYIHSYTVKIWSVYKRPNIDPIWNGILEYGPVAVVTGFTIEIVNQALFALTRMNTSRFVGYFFNFMYDYMPINATSKGHILILENSVLTICGLDGWAITSPTLRAEYALDSSVKVNEAVINASAHIGGTCLAIPLIIAIIMASTSYRRKWLTKIALIPAIFNSSEIIVYGAPIIFSPILGIPAIILPQLNYFIYQCMTMNGYLPAVSTVPHKIVPAPIYAYMMTDGSFLAVLVVLALIIMDVAVYIPFVKLMDEYDLYVLNKHTENLIEAYKQAEQDQRHFEDDNITSQQLRSLNTLGNVLRLGINKVDVNIYNNVHFNYQPQINRRGKIIGAEMLLRWAPINEPHLKHNKYMEKVMVYPPLVIYLAERIDEMEKLNRIIIDNAVEELNHLKVIGIKGIKLSINMPLKCITPSLKYYVDEKIKEYGIEPKYLWFDIMQQQGPADYDSDNLNTLLAMKDDGYIMGIDGFNTNNKAFNYLQKGIFNSITLGETLTNMLSIKGVQTNDYIIRMLVEYSREQDTYITANHIEDKTRMRNMAQSGVNFFQGYAIHEPMARDVFNNVMILSSRKNGLESYTDEQDYMREHMN